jgi:transcription-repair coupling factor (superfamily II helicase)
MVSFQTRSLPSFQGKLPSFAEAAKQWAREGCRLRLFGKSSGQAQRLREALKEYELNLPLEEEFFSSSLSALLVGELSSGFCLPELKLIVVSEEEVFGGRPHEAPRPHHPPKGPVLPLEGLRYGDYLVHVDHGIGLYRGLRRIRAGGMESEYLQIKYAGTDKLYVPLDKLNLVHRYLGADAAPPELDRLGSQTWSRAKEKAKAGTKKIAKELLELYASRKLAPGYSFPADSPWQAEFEAAFPYEETPDQLQTIREVKRDMEGSHPMDRLVCGDVGYGKTEVAMRSAFKACLEGRQVAVLVPTTVLALQHHQTFSERFSPFPLRVEMLSRFRTGREQAEIIKGLATGEIDVVIGTHRLLQKDVRFHQLGLLIIDEEHRFGVTDKERIKQLKKEVDCLTLTATPIPRTLYMSLVGLRDISIINTPPEERLSVKTYISRFEAEVIKEAIEREMQRQGQVFFVHNRVQSIQRIAGYLRKLLPAARIAVAHGQMPEEELEQIMYEFYAKKHDVLLSTSIVESGLDLSNANTILIHRADRLGLAQLYQLRGRVGRDRHQAFAYLLVPDSSLLSRESRERLQALSELSELGSGYELAMRDLQIRGAGNLLGPEQHGHVAAVGFELYRRLLEETIRELRGEKVEAPLEPSLRLKVEAHLPEAYVPDPDQRFVLYKRLLALEQRGDLEDFQREMEDRFGEMPEPARHLIRISELRLLAKAFRVREIEARKGGIRLIFEDKPPIDPAQVMKLLSDGKGALRYIPENILEMRLAQDDPGKQIEGIKNLLQGLG